MASPSKQTRELERLRRREARQQAQGEVLATKGRIGLGFGGTYFITQAVLPNVWQWWADNQAIADGAVGVIGGVIAFADDEEAGDVAFGAALVGALQTLDNIGARFTAWRASRGG